MTDTPKSGSIFTQTGLMAKRNASEKRFRFYGLVAVVASLMMLAFLVDQIQQRCCPQFQAAWKKRWSNKRSLWEEIRNMFQAFAFGSMQELYEAIVSGITRQQPVLQDSS